MLNLSTMEFSLLEHIIAIAFLLIIAGVAIWAIFKRSK